MKKPSKAGKPKPDRALSNNRNLLDSLRRRPTSGARALGDTDSTSGTSADEATQAPAVPDINRAIRRLSSSLGGSGQRTTANTVEPDDNDDLGVPNEPSDNRRRYADSTTRATKSARKRGYAAGAVPIGTAILQELNEEIRDAFDGELGEHYARGDVRSVVEDALLAHLDALGRDISEIQRLVLADRERRHAKRTRWARLPGD